MVRPHHAVHEPLSSSSLERAWIHDIMQMTKMGIYKACDIRGIYGDDLTERDAFLIGRAVGTMRPDSDIVVGGDVRTSTPPLKSALIEGLLACGSRVTDIGAVPTPVFYFARTLLGIDAGIMVTASHNPPEFNGFKPTLGPLPITEDEVRQIGLMAGEAGARCNVPLPGGAGVLRVIDVIEDYRTFITSMSPKPADADPFNVVVDCGNGCFSDIAPSIFAELGYGVEGLFCVPDGAFPHRSPNSAVSANLTALSSKVVETGANLGVAFDGDGDRVSFVDEKGRMVSADKCIVILARMLLPRNPGTSVVYDLKCSSVAPESIREAGGVALAERSGHTFIKTRMIREGALLGGEISGHYFHRALHGGDDGLYTALLMARHLASGRLPFSRLSDAVPEYAITPDIRLPYPGDRSALIEKIAAAFPSENVSRIDGVKVNFRGGWGLARVSVTEPVITLRFEAEQKDMLKEIIREFLDPVPGIYDTVVHEAGL